MAPRGHNVGQAYVQVIASFDQVQRDIASFFSKVGPLRVGVDERGLRKDTAEAAARATDKASDDAVIRPSVDKSRLTRDTRQAVDESIKKVGRPTVTPDVDISRVADKLRSVEAAKAVEVPVNLKTANAEAQFQEFLARKRKAQVDLDVRERTLRDKLAALEGGHVEVDAEIELRETRDKQKLDMLLAERKQATTVDVTAELKTRDEQLKALLTERRSSVIDVDAELGKARAELDTFKKKNEVQTTKLDLKIDEAQEKVRKLYNESRRKAATIEVKANLDVARKQLSQLKAERHEAQIRYETNLAEITAKIEALKASRVRPTVEVDDDIARVRAELATLKGTKVRPVAAIDDDIERVRADLDRLDGKRVQMHAEVDTNTDKLRAELAALQAKRSAIEVDVDAKTAEYHAKMAAAETAADSLDGRDVDVNMEAEDASRALFIFGALVAAISAVGYAAPAAAAAVATIPAAITGMGQTVGALVAAFSGIGDATSAMQAVDDEATTRGMANSHARQSALDAVANANYQIANAQSSLTRAQINADRTAITSTQQVADARRALAEAYAAADRTAITTSQQLTDAQRAVTEAHAAAARQVATAERSLADAQRDSVRAQQELNQARAEARERLADLRQSVTAAALDEEAALLRVIQARQDLAEARSIDVDDLAMRQLELAARQAAQSLAEVRRRQAELTREVERARDALAETREEGREQLAELRQEIETSAAAEASALDRAQKAQQSLNQAQAAGVGGEKLRELDIAARLAEASLTDARYRHGELKDEYVDTQQEIRQAVQDGKQQIKDLQFDLKGAALDEESAILRVQQARAKLAAAQRTDAGDLRLRQLELSARRAELQLRDVRQRHQELRQEATRAARAGVSGDEQVVAARQRVHDASRRVTDAERALVRTRRDGAQSVAAAQRQLARAEQQAGWARTDAANSVADALRALGRSEQQAGWARADAARGITDAQRGLSKAQQQAAKAQRNLTGAGVASSAAMDKLRLAMADLTPEGRAFALFLHNRFKPAMRGIGDAVQAATLPKMQTALSHLLKLTPLVTDALAETGSTLGDLAIQGAEMMTSGPWQRDFKTIAAGNISILETLGQAGFDVADAFRHISVAAMPFMNEMAAGFADAMTNFRDFVAQARKSGAMSEFFAEAADTLEHLFEVIGQVAGGLWDLSQALAPLGKVLLDVIGNVVELVGAFAEAHPVITRLIATYALFKIAQLSLGRSVGGLFTAVKQSRAGWQMLGNRIRGTTVDATGATTQVRRLRDSTTGLGRALYGVTTPIASARSAVSSLRGVYQRGATVGENWATRTTAAVGRTTTSLATLPPAFGTNIRHMNRMLPATNSLAGGLRRLSDTVTTTLVAPLARAATTTLPAFAGGLRGLTRAASGVGSVVKTGVSRALGSLTAFLGGPWGVVLAGATVALGVFMHHQQRSAERAAEQEATEREYADALRETNGVIDESIRSKVALKLEEQELLDNADHLGVSTGKLVDAIARGGDAANDFQGDLTKVKDRLLEHLGANDVWRWSLERSFAELVKTGGAAEDHADTIDMMVSRYRAATGASDEATDAYRGQLTELLDLAGGMRNNRTAFDGQVDGNRRVKGAVDDSTRSLEDNLQALQERDQWMLESVDADLRYRGSVVRTREAEKRFNQVLRNGKSTALERQRAGLSLEEALLAQVRAAGEAARATSTARTEDGKARDSAIATRRELVTLANKYGDKLPRSIRQMLKQQGIAKTRTGEYRVELDKIPKKLSTEATFHDKQARRKAKKYARWFKGFFADLTAPAPPKPPKGAPPLVFGGASGAILPMAGGGTLPADIATIVAPNTWRVIGDRQHDDEAFIPLNSSRRSARILAESAARMGYDLAPMAHGGIAEMARGGMVQPTIGIGGALTLTPAQLSALSVGLRFVTSRVDEFTDALGDNEDATRRLIKIGSRPLVRFLASKMTPSLDRLHKQLGTQVPRAIHREMVPAFKDLRGHAGKSTETIRRLDDRFGPLRAELRSTAGRARTAWRSIADVSDRKADQVTDALTGMRHGLNATGNAFGNVSDWVRQSWSKIRGRAARPVRDVLRGPINKGLIRAWNRLDRFFDMGRHLDAVPVKFRTGGRVAGIGNTDSRNAKLTPGEIVIRKDVAEPYKDFLLAFNSGQPEALQAAGPPHNKGPQHFARGGLVADTGSAYDEALRRTTTFARRQHGKPYVWGAVGPHGYDCSGFQSALVNQLRGQYPHRRLFTTASFANGPTAGFARGLRSAYAIGVSQARRATPGHMAATLAGRNAEAGGAPSQTKFISRASGADDPQFATRFHLPVVGGKFVSGGAGGFDPSGEIARIFADVPKRLRAFREKHPRAYLAKGGARIAKALDRAARQKAAQILAASYRGVDPRTLTNVQRGVRVVASRFGWHRSPQWDALSSLINAESSWNPTAANPTSSARGLFQKMTSIHGPVESTPTGQAEWGLNYIRRTYGTPAKAWGFHQRNNWYDDGGWLPPGLSVTANHTGKPEAVLTSDQWRTLTRLAGLDRDRAPERNVVVNARTDASPEHIAHAVDRHLALARRL